MKSPFNYRFGLPSPFYDNETGFSPLGPFAEWPWFLKYDTWDLAGVWLDNVPWAPDWFLATGSINVYGAWADSEAWA